MFSKVLVANRGEIAVRIIRACRDLSIPVVAVYSTADRDSPHVRLADESVCVGPPPAGESYLNIPNIIAAAEITGADAVHPGYGFLSENAHFAEICQDCNLTFIGPPPSALVAMGNKAQARKSVSQAGVPILEGSDDALEDPGQARRVADRIGYPVILKAAAGGGGKGMRIVRSGSEVEDSFVTAQMEARSAFGDGGLYLERFVEDPRHIEVQVLADSEGTIANLGERECSVQRRHQKLIEESPSPVVTPAMRRLLGIYASKAARQVAYRNAGTIEFLTDRSGRFAFIEMNTRLQVEHPVTETVTGIDLVREQIRIAAGFRLDLPRPAVVPRGHAIEFRINAEDPERDFAPSPGRITHLVLPGGPWVRVDTIAQAGGEVLPFYDSLVAKLVVWGPTRPDAIARARRALRELRVEGIKTTLEFHRAVLQDPGFVEGQYDTGFVERLLHR